MIRISKLTDYAVVLLVALARSGQSMTSRSLAEATGLPHPTVGKVTKLLTRSGILSSVRGLRGGYSLARDPKALPVGEIIEVMEGPIGLTDCAVVSGGGTCGHSGHCPVREPWGKINHVVRDALMGLTLAAMYDDEEVRS